MNALRSHYMPRRRLAALSVALTTWLLSAIALPARLPTPSAFDGHQHDADRMLESEILPVGTASTLYPGIGYIGDRLVITGGVQTPGDLKQLLECYAAAYQSGPGAPGNSEPNGQATENGRSARGERWPHLDIQVNPETILIPLDGTTEGDGAAMRTLTTSQATPAVGASFVQWQDSLLSIGGWTPDGVVSGIDQLTLHDGALQRAPLDQLPEGLMFAGAVVVGDRLLVAGGLPRQLPPVGHSNSTATGNDPGESDTSASPAATRFAIWSLNLQTPEEGWESHDFPVSAPWFCPSLVIRRDENERRDRLFVMGGWMLDAESEEWIPNTTVWSALTDDLPHNIWRMERPMPDGLDITHAVPIGPSHILAFAHMSRHNPFENVPQTELLMYHVFTDTWSRFDWLSQHDNQGFLYNLPDNEMLFIGYMPDPPPLAGDDGHNHKPVAEQAENTPPPCGRLLVKKCAVRLQEKRFGLLDFIAVGGYIGVLVLIGARFSRQERGTEDYFLGGRRIPWWAAGISIYATGVSAISFMAIPAKTYATNWLYIWLGVFPLFSTFIAAYVFVPLLRKLEITTVMEYFEMRFHTSVRLLASFLTVIGQVGGRMSVTLLLPSLALSAVTGLDLTLCILTMGALATAYTILGGISAVIWTDVVQVFVMFGGAILSFIIILLNVDGGFSGMISTGLEYRKFETFDFRMDLSTATIWVFAIWGIGDIFGRLGQESLQRAFATDGVKAARRSMITCAIISIPGTLLFYIIGTALFAYYHQFPQDLDPVMQNDAVFPLFIAQKLPAGIAGLVIAGLFAAAMSTLDSAMNSASTIIVKDFYSLYRKDSDEGERLLMARIVTLVAGIIGTGLALYMASMGNLGSVWDLFSEIVALIGGGFGGVIVLGLLTKRANTAGALVGTVIGTIVLLTLKITSPVMFFIYGTIAIVVCFTTGYLFSMLYDAIRPSPQRNLDGLTLWTLKPSAEAAAHARETRD